MSRAIVLLSGGQDSTTALFWARACFDDLIAVSVDYGQRHIAELEGARRIAALAGVKQHLVLPLPALASIGDSALVDRGISLLAEGGYRDAAMPQGLPTSFVPGRNALLLTLAAAVAVRAGARDIVAGVCQTDYSGYPDCRREFIDALEVALALAMPSSSGPFRIVTPLMHLTKAETVRLGRRLPGCWSALALSVTCYEGRRPGCGACSACLLRARGFVEAHEQDPAVAAAA